MPPAPLNQLWWSSVLSASFFLIIVVSRSSSLWYRSVVLSCFLVYFVIFISALIVTAIFDCDSAHFILPTMVREPTRAQYCDVTLHISASLFFCLFVVCLCVSFYSPRVIDKYRFLSFKNFTSKDTVVCDRYCFIMLGKQYREACVPYVNHNNHSC